MLVLLCQCSRQTLGDVRAKPQVDASLVGRLLEAFKWPPRKGFKALRVKFVYAKNIGLTGRI